jgi:hypothetical protein
VYKTIFGISEGRKGPRYEWEDKSSMYHNEIESKIVDWIRLDLLSAVMKPVAQSPDY